MMGHIEHGSVGGTCIMIINEYARTQKEGI